MDAALRYTATSSARVHASSLPVATAARQSDSEQMRVFEALGVLPLCGLLVPRDAEALVAAHAFARTELARGDLELALRWVNELAEALRDAADGVSVVSEEGVQRAVVRARSSTT